MYRISNLSILAASCMLSQLAVHANNDSFNFSDEESHTTPVITILSDSSSESENSSDNEYKLKKLHVEIDDTDYFFDIDGFRPIDSLNKSLDITLYMQNSDLKNLIPAGNEVEDAITYNTIVAPLLNNASVREILKNSKNKEYEIIALSIVDENTGTMIAAIDCDLDKELNLSSLEYMDKTFLQIENDDELTKKFLKRHWESTDSEDEDSSIPSKKVKK